MVIHDIGQMISWQLVGTLIEHLIVENVALDTNLATNQVIHQYFLTGLDLKANHILLTVSNQFVDLLLRKGQRVTHLRTSVAIVLEILNLSTLSLQLLRGIESYIGLIGIKQLLYILLIYIATLALTIRTFVATKANALVELDAQPLKRLDDILLCTRHETVGISILDTEYEIATMLLGKQVIIQGGTYAADMQCSRRTWCKTHPYSSIRHIFS